MFQKKNTIFFCKRNRPVWAISFVLGALFFSLFSVKNAHAIAFSPSSIEIGRVANEQLFQLEVFVLRKNPSADSRARVQLSGSLFENALNREYEVSLPKEETNISIFIPVDTRGVEPGGYEGKISVVEKATDEEIAASGSTVFEVGGSGTVTAEVVNSRIEEYVVSDVSAVVKADEVSVYLDVENMGVVPYRFDRADILIVNERGEEVYSEEFLGTDFAHVLPGSVKKVELPVEKSLERGDYQLQANVWDEGRNILNESKSFTIVNDTSRLTQELSGGTDSALYVFIGVVAVVLIGGGIYIFQKKR